MQMNNQKKLWQIVTLLAADLALLVLISLLTSPAADAMHMGYSGERVAVIQRQLHKSNFYSGEISGKYGLEMRSAVRNFQKSTSLDASGETDYATVTAMGISSRTHLCFTAETELLARCVQESGSAGYASMLKTAEEILSKTKAARTLGSYACEYYPDAVNSPEPSPDAYAAALQAMRKR